MNEKKVKDTTIKAFYDIETFTFNRKAGEVVQADLKTREYIVQWGLASEKVYDKAPVKLEKNFIAMLDKLVEIAAFNGVSTVELLGHNINKYDNHFLLQALLRAGFNLFNQLTSKTIRPLINSVDKKVLDNEQVIASVVKSSTNITLVFKYKDILFTTADTYLKSGSSLAQLGSTLLAEKKIKESDVKTDGLDYTKYDLEEDLDTEGAIEEYASSIYEGLNEEELKYCVNDIKVLQAYYTSYKALHPEGWDFNKMSRTQNIMYSYTHKNQLSTLQMMGVYNGERNKKMNIQYQAFKSPTESFNNLFDFLKYGYTGGLNIYNDKYIGKEINSKIISNDINSSYPFVMYKEEIPSFVNGILEPGEYTVDELMEDFKVFEISADEFNRIIKGVKSSMLRKAFVKIFNKHLNISVINSVKLKTMLEIGGASIKTLKINGGVSYKCVRFGAVDTLSKFYFEKTEGGLSQKKKLKPGQGVDFEKSTCDNIVFCDKEVRSYTENEVSMKKVLLNGAYGAPALNNRMKVGEFIDDVKINIINNGFINNERNIIFSLFITSKAMYNLLKPFKNCNYKELDNYWYYSDTDSIYYDERLQGVEIELNDNNLGAWDCEVLDRMKILNHKQYMYEKGGKCSIKLAGVEKGEIKRLEKLGFDVVSAEYFKEGGAFKNLVSVRNKQGVISLLERETVLKKGNKYKDRLDGLEILKLNIELQHLYKLIKERGDIVDEVEDGRFFSVRGRHFSEEEIIKMFEPENGLYSTLMDLEVLVEEFKSVQEKFNNMESLKKDKYTVLDMLDYVQQIKLEKCNDGKKLLRRKNTDDRYKGVSWNSDLAKVVHKCGDIGFCYKPEKNIFKIVDIRKKRAIIEMLKEGILKEHLNLEYSLDGMFKVYKRLRTLFNEQFSKTFGDTLC